MNDISNGRSHAIVCRLACPRHSWRSRFSWLAPLLLSLAFTLDARAESISAAPENAAPLQLGLFPHLSNQLLIKKYQKLITYLEDHLERPVLVHSAPDFSTFTKRAAQGRYDLYLTAPHLAAYHEAHNRHKRLARFSKEIRAVVVVAEDSPYKTLTDLRGKAVATADPIAVVTLLGEVMLAKHGIPPHKDITLKYSPSHTAALYAVAEGKVDAAIIGSPSYKMFNTSGQNRPLRILTGTGAVPHMMLMSPSRLPQAESDELKAALLNFTADGAGQAFFANVPFGDMTTITDQDMARLAAMLSLLEQRLKE